MFWNTCGFHLQGQITLVTGIGLPFNHSAVQMEAVRFLVLSTEQPKVTQYHHTRMETSNCGDFMIVCVEEHD